MFVKFKGGKYKKINVKLRIYMQRTLLRKKRILNSGHFPERYNVNVAYQNSHILPIYVLFKDGYNILVLITSNEWMTYE